MYPWIIVIVLAVIFSRVDSQGQGSGTPPCADQGVNCADNINLCASPVYQALMRRECPQTCGACTTGSCKDTNPRLVSFIIEEQL